MRSSLGLRDPGLGDLGSSLLKSQCIDLINNTNPGDLCQVHAELFVGGGYETAASPDATMEPGAMDANNIQMSLGGRFLIANYVYFGLGYTQIQFLNRTVTDSQLASEGGVPVQLPTLQQDGNGSYTQWVGVVDLNLEKQF